MFHFVLFFLVSVLTFFAWQLVHSAPRSLSMFLPPRIVFGVGLGLVVMALFGAYWSAAVMNWPQGVLACFVKAYVGVWFMLSTSSAARGSEEDERMLRRVFAILGMMMAMVIAALYLPTIQLISLFNLVMIGGCLLVTASYLHTVDRGR